MSTIGNRSETWVGEAGQANTTIIEEWSRALAGDEPARARWYNLDCGDWSWHPDGLHLGRGQGEWFSLVAHRDAVLPWPNFLLEVTIQGSARGAGISFGPFRDFMVEAATRPRHLQLEVDVNLDCWRFRADGQLIAPSWWNAAVTRTDDIVSGVMTIKACQPEHVVFRDLTLRRFDASCKVSVIIICNRFLQRLRVALRNWCHQDAPSGAFEVLVVNPGSPDGTHEHLRAVARGYPDARICEIAAPIELATNKGALINHAIRDAHGEWIWLTDADCLFPTTAINTVLEYVPDRGNRLFFGERRHLSDSITSALLAGRADAVADFATLASARSDTPPENAPWGYTQIIRRADFGRLRYTESFNHFAHSDGEFIERCKRRGFPLEQVPGLCCLHLEHPFAWHDNDAFL